MQEEEPQLEIRHVTEPIGLPLEDFDLIVEPFERPSGDTMTEIAEHARPMVDQRISQALKMRIARGPGLDDPAEEERLGRLLVGRIPKWAATPL